MQSPGKAQSDTPSHELETIENAVPSSQSDGEKATTVNEAKAEEEGPREERVTAKAWLCVFVSSPC